MSAAAGAGDDVTQLNADLAHLVVRRGLSVPEGDRAALGEYWARIRQLRGAVDERLLAEREMALTWTAVDLDGD